MHFYFLFFLHSCSRHSPPDTDKGKNVISELLVRRESVVFQVGAVNEGPGFTFPSVRDAGQSILFICSCAGDIHTRSLVLTRLRLQSSDLHPDLIKLWSRPQLGFFILRSPALCLAVTFVTSLFLLYLFFLPPAQFSYEIFQLQFKIIQLLGF